MSRLTVEEELEKFESTRSLTTVLVSPRVEEIPKPSLITISVSVFILLCASAAVFLIPRILAEEENVSVFFPILDNRENLRCEPIKLIEIENFQFQAIQDNNASELDLTFNTMAMDITKPERFVTSSLTFSEDQTLEFLEAMRQVNSAGFDFDFSFFDAFEEVEFIEFLGNDEFNLFLDEVTCNVTFTESNFLPKLVSKCVQDRVFELEVDIFNGFADGSMLAYMFNIHIPSTDWDRLGSFFSPTKLQEIDDFVQPRQVSLIDRGLGNTNAFCSEVPSGDIFTDFGLYSGFGYMFEGILTFVFAITIFKGRLGLEQRPFEKEGVYLATKNIKVLTEKQIEDAEEEAKKGSLLISEKDEFEPEDNKKIFAQHARNIVLLEDLKRAIHNPRCKFLERAGTVSLLSSIVFFLSTAVLALVVRSVDQIEICSFIKFDDISTAIETQTCLGIALTQSFALNIDDFGIFTMDIFLNINDFVDFTSTQNPFVNDDLATQLDLLCKDEDVIFSIEGDPSCLSNIDGLDLEASEPYDNYYYYYGGYYNSTYYNDYEYYFENGFGSPAITSSSNSLARNLLKLQKRELSEVTAGFEVYQVNLESGLSGILQISFSPAGASATLILSKGKDINIEVLSDVEFSNKQEAQRFVFSYLRTFAKETFAAPNTIFGSLARTTTTCCRTEPRFNYFEYFGIMLAYMIFIEGFIVLAVAFLFFRVAGRKKIVDE